jgi:rifampicin phosphotransferase
MSQSGSQNIIWFADAAGTDHALVGGKGANLGNMTGKGFQVPPGFTVSTDAYRAHVADSGIRSQIETLLGEIDYADAVGLEDRVAKIRALITKAKMPDAVIREIASAYSKVGATSFVAVRSSGTAEDLEGASFAGLHDTYLDIMGQDALADAVKRCWASMWTGRAVAYRHNGGFDHFSSAIAVVVQKMVKSEISGVMFTGNPVNGATDQIFINASYGLGEAVVSGIVTPDEYVVRHRDLKILNAQIGSKLVQVVRDPARGIGTVEAEVPEALRGQQAMTDAQIKELADLGCKIQAAYGAFPQDIEWGYSEGQFYVLQSRPVTGVDFSWDADVTNSVQGNDDGCAWDELWSRTFPQEMWTGAISPLMFSWRCWGLNQCHSLGVQTFLYPELDYTTRRLWIYYKGVSYYNCKADLDLIKTAVHPIIRPGMLEKLPKDWHDEALSADFDMQRFIDSYLHVEKHRPDMGLNWWKAIRDDFINSKKYRDFTKPLAVADLAAKSDTDLRTYIGDVMREEIASYDPPWNGLLYPMRDALGFIAWLCENWYTGGNPTIFMDLMTGTRNPTVTTDDNFAVWELANMIHESPELKSLFERHPDVRFFDHLAQCRDGPAFQAKYDEHVRLRGHRGHPDRDIYFDRRADDPMVDLRLFPALMGAPNPRIQEHLMTAKLEATIDHVAENLEQQPMGVLKSRLFRFLIDFAHNSLEYRDNEREVMDWSTYAIKLGFEEVGRRCVKAGVFEDYKDCYFLTMEELYAAQDGTDNRPLTLAKIKARKKNFHDIDTRAMVPSHYLQYGRPAVVDLPDVGEGGLLKGKTTSVGKVKGTARVVTELKQIGRVNKGEILIVHATDPGWTPVFMLIKGIVLETGGLISHGALLAREYGLPGVQIEGALQLIPDGATITLDGDAGIVIIHDDEDNSSDERADSAELEAA